MRSATFRGVAGGRGGGGGGPGMNTYSFCHTQFKIQILIEVEYLTEGLFRGLTLTLKPDGKKV